MKTHITELSIVTAVECLNEVYYDEVVCNILISNLNLIDQHGITVSNALKEKLSNFISNYLKNYHTFVDLPIDNFSQVIHLVSMLLEYQDVSNQSKTTEIVLPTLLQSCDKIVQSSSSQTDANELEKLIKYFRIIETLLKSVSKLERNSKIYCILTTLEDLLSRSFVIRNQCLLVYSFSLLAAYYHIVPETKLVYKVWSQAVAVLLTDRSYCEFYLIIVSYLIGCSFSKKEIQEILNSDEFWTALQLCLEDDQCIQNHALHVLKYASFNMCGTREHPRCKLNHSNVFDCAYSKEYTSWWKTYFVIMENLNEKQTHLVLPTFSLVNNLLDDKIVSNDKFWILRLLENGLKHDSRAVRIEALLFLLDVNVSSFNKSRIRYIVRIMLTALNDSYLFRKAFKLDKFHQIEQSFAKCIVHFDCEQLKIFYQFLIQLKWSPVPLFYCLKSITRFRHNFQCLDANLIRASGDMILNIVKFHHIKIRAAVQSLFIELILAYSEKNINTVNEVLTIFSKFNDEECLHRNTTSWRLTTAYLRQSSTRENLKSYLNHIASEKVDSDEILSGNSARFLARVVILFEDAFSPVNHCEVIGEWISSFENVLHKPYLNRRIQNNRLTFIVFLLKVEQSCVNTVNHEATVRYYSLVEGYFMHLCSYVVKSLMDCDNFDRIEFYENSLTEFSRLFREKFSSLVNTASLEEWLVKSSQGLKSDSIHVRYTSLKIISWIYELIYRYPKLHIRIDNWKNILAKSTSNYLNNFQIKSPVIERINDLQTTIPGKLYSQFTNNLWSTMELYLHFEKQNAFEAVEISSLFDIVLDALDLARRENLVYVFKFLKVFFSLELVLKYETIISKVMSISWKLVEETSTTQYYSDSLKGWIQAFFQQTFLSRKIYQMKLILYVNELLKKVAEDGGQSYHSMILIVTEFNSIPNLYESFPDVITVLINIFSISHINRKDQRIENETIEYIRGLGNDVSVNQIIKFDSVDSAEEMRLMALNLLLKFICNETIKKEEWTEIICLLMPSDETSKKRYFNDSAVHRIKHKRLQLLLIFESVLFNDTSLLEKDKLSEKLFYFAVNSLLLEPHQPSVRYMLEWLIIRLIVHFDHHLNEKFWECFSEASEERIGSICSFISIAFHLANVIRTESIINTAIESVLPWTMAQHFNARLYAQTVLAKLIEINSGISEKYYLISQSLVNSLKTGNAVKNAIKLQNDFYFSYFHPTEHFSLETILWDLPRLSNICREEWIPVDLYETFIIFGREIVPTRNKTSDLANFSQSSWIAKATSANHDDDKYSNVDNSAHSLQECQKKFTPQTDLLSWASCADLKKEDNLIVVASLIDRAPNLGGLTRTCEIFAVSTLIVNNLEITRSKEYASVSLTAEKHVQIDEIKRYNLFVYLKNKKEQGYSIIGVEQTANSKNLSEFSFPKKSVLVLGNEKEGIPANLLCLFDSCVEIPQKGVIRSLNVHVSASLFIWEYSKQHVFKD